MTRYMLAPFAVAALLAAACGPDADHVVRTTIVVGGHGIPASTQVVYHEDEAMVEVLVTDGDTIDVYLYLRASVSGWVRIHGVDVVPDDIECDIYDQGWTGRCHMSMPDPYQDIEVSWHSGGAP